MKAWPILSLPESFPRDERNPAILLSLPRPGSLNFVVYAPSKIIRIQSRFFDDHFIFILVPAVMFAAFWLCFSPITTQTPGAAARPQ